MVLIAQGDMKFSPTSTFLVGDSRSGAQYSTINDAILEVQSRSPSESNRMIIYVSPGVYNEDVFLPDFVYLVGLGAGVLLTGNSTADGIILDVGQCSWVEKITIAPTLANKSVGMIVRDAASAVGGVISSPVVGTLVVSGDLSNTEETFTFTGESTVNDVVATINATAVNVRAYNRYGKLAIMASSTRLVIYDSGTANSILGFPSTTTVYQRAYESTVYINNVSIIGVGDYTQVQNQKELLHGLVFEERKFFGCICNSISVMGSNAQATGRGIVVKRGNPIVNNLLCVAHTNGIGIELEEDFAFTGANTQIAIGTGVFIGNDVDIYGEDHTKFLQILTTYPLNVEGTVEHMPMGSLGGFSVASDWFLGNINETNVVDAITSLSQYSRKHFIDAKELYSPAIGGASEVELGSPEFIVKSFGNGADAWVTSKLRHIQTVSGLPRSTATMKILYTISDNGGANDSIYVEASIASVAVGENAVLVVPETVEQTVDVSTKQSGILYELELDFSDVGVAAPGDIIQITIYRKGTNANDTYLGNWYVWGVEYEF